MNLPNRLTVFRIILVPIMVLIPYFNIQGEVLGIPITWILIDAIFIIASITDTLDGKIATYTGDSKWISNEKSRIKN